MDIVLVPTFLQLKASLEKLKLKQKFFLGVFLLALLLNLIPHKSQAFAFKIPTPNEISVLVFDLNDKSYLDHLAYLNSHLTIIKKDDSARLQAVNQGKLAVRVEEYLRARKSPLADYSHTLVSVKNWKKIVALSNAESSLCKHYPESTANCWGVGGSNLWDFGATLNDGILGMNNFLNQYPKRSNLKYAEMSFNQMNGLYKQPAANHWLYNTQKTYEDLSIIEKSI